MIHYESETPEQIAERQRLGITLTPYYLPRPLILDKFMAKEILSRYVFPPIEMVRFGGDCIALGRMLGRLEERRRPWWKRIFS